MTFGRYLRKIRKTKNFTQKHLAKHVGKTRAYIAQIESDKFPPPPDPVIEAMAAKLGQDPDVMRVMAGRIPAGLVEIIQEHPFQYQRLLKSLEGSSAEFVDEMTDSVSRRKIRDGDW